MLLATLVTIAFMGASPINLALVLAAIAIGGIIAWVSGKRVAMTDMPQMIALYNGMGGGAAAAIAAVELYSGNEHNVVHLTMAAIGGFIGAVSFSGLAPPRRLARLGPHKGHRARSRCRGRDPLGRRCAAR